MAWPGIALVLACGLPLRGAESLSSVNVYPNPARVYEGQTVVTFDRLTDPADILIFAHNGDLVREQRVENAGFRFQWDLTNDAGNRVATGVYLYVIRNDRGEKRTGKLAVLR